MIAHLHELSQKISKRCLHRLYKCRKGYWDPGIVSLDKDSDPGHPAWFLSANSHSKLLTCHVSGLSSSDMQGLRQAALIFHSDNVWLVGQNWICPKFSKFNFDYPTPFNMKMPL